jgi:hypothetical protein
MEKNLKSFFLSFLQVLVFMEIIQLIGFIILIAIDQNNPLSVDEMAFFLLKIYGVFIISCLIIFITILIRKKQINIKFSLILLSVFILSYYLNPMDILDTTVGFTVNYITCLLSLIIVFFVLIKYSPSTNEAILK